jgi:hypothetical protein
MLTLSLTLICSRTRGREVAEHRVKVVEDPPLIDGGAGRAVTNQTVRLPGFVSGGLSPQTREFPAES